MLVCEFHCQEAENVELLNKYKQKVINPGNTFSDFTKNISISNFCEAYLINSEKGTEDASIFFPDY